MGGRVEGHLARHFGLIIKHNIASETLKIAPKLASETSKKAPKTTPPNLDPGVYLRNVFGIVFFSGRVGRERTADA